MNRDFFDQLDTELAELTRQGAHLGLADPATRRAGGVLRRFVACALVVVAMAAALVTEFPASASGHAQLARAVTTRWL